MTFVIWCIAQALGIYIDVQGSHSVDNSSIFFLSLMPLGMLPFLDPNSEPESFDKLHILDFLQVCIFGLAVFLCFSPRLWSPHTARTLGPFTWGRSIAFETLLVGAFVLRALLSEAKEVRAFFLRMAAFLTSSALADSYALNPKGDLPAGGWFDLIWSALLVFPILIAAAWKGREEAAPRARGSQNFVTDQFFPLLYPLFSFVLLAHAGGAYPIVSRVAFAVAFVAFAARVIVIQRRQQRSEAQLLVDVAKRKQAEKALQGSELQYRLLFAGNPLPMWVFDRNTLQFLAVNAAAIRQYGYTEEEFRSMTIAEIRPEEDVPRLQQSIKERGDGFQPQYWRHRRRDGSIVDVEITAHDLIFNGIEARLIAANDVTERRRAERALQSAEQKYRNIFEDAVIGIFQSTPDGRPLSINRALAQLHGYDSPERFMAEVSNVVADLFVQPSQMEELKHVLEDKGVVRDVELEFYRRDRTKKWGLASLRAVRDSSGHLSLIEGTVEDITDRKLAEQRVQFLAYYDALTELPNRSLLQDRIGQALASAKRRNEKVALMFLDLDRFKIINDSLGHSFGDLLLQNVAERLKKCARAQDTVARIGGDEFLIVLCGIKDASDAAVAAERVMDAMVADFAIQGRKCNVTCSIGISIYPEHGLDDETLIKNADAAMYCGKEAGRNVIRFFTHEMNAEVVERLTIEHNLRLALKRGEFYLLYQPQIDIHTEETLAMEALIRWRQPEMGVVSPDRFIGVAENSGLILPIGEWVLKTACAAAQAWQSVLPRVSVAVNVSAIQFRQEGFAKQVEEALRESGLSPECLELEVTESMLLSNADLTSPVLRDLRRMGVKLAIDDFGTGYSSLSYLRRLPVHKLKIDRSFIKTVPANPDDAAITATVISMGKSLNLKVIAEGVETEAQMAFLRQHQCDEVQGYYFSKPIALEDVLKRPKAAAVHAG